MKVVTEDIKTAELDKSYKEIIKNKNGGMRH